MNQPLKPFIFEPGVYVHRSAAFIVLVASIAVSVLSAAGKDRAECSIAAGLRLSLPTSPGRPTLMAGSKGRVRVVYTDGSCFNTGGQAR